MNRILAIVGGLMLIACPFLPFVSALGMSVSMWDLHESERGVCYFFIAMGVIGAVVGLADKKWLNIVNILLGLLSAALGLKYFSDAKAEGGTAGIAIWLIIAGGALLLIGGIMGVAKKKSAVAAA